MEHAWYSPLFPVRCLWEIWVSMNFYTGSKVGKVACTQHIPLCKCSYGFVSCLVGDRSWHLPKLGLVDPERTPLLCLVRGQNIDRKRRLDNHYDSVSVRPLQLLKILVKPFSLTYVTFVKRKLLWSQYKDRRIWYTLIDYWG
jgi:hypothetical protein